MYANALNVVLNVNFYEDGTGEIAEGSFYPTETIENCIADITILPITDILAYTSNLNAGITIPNAGILDFVPDAMHAPLPYAGQLAGSISLSQTNFFDYFPSTPIHPTLCDGADNCFDVTLGNGQTIAGGDPLPGFAGGYVLQGNLPTIAPDENECADLYIEWHAIDGFISGSGLGDIVGSDEDGDDTDFDRIWGMETITVTYMMPGTACGNLNYPILGDVSAEFSAECVDFVGEGNEGYIWDGTGPLSSWGNFFTYNYLNQIQIDDSDNDIDNNNQSSGGRIIMKFDPMCVQDIMVRHMMLEFIDLEGSCLDNLCPNSGDMNVDMAYNVLDVVLLVNCVLGENCEGCMGDINGDTAYNVLDVVQLVNCVLAETCGG